MTGVSLALIGLGTILTASTLVWMISVRLEDASIADICWGLGFVLLAWLYCLPSPTPTPRSWLVAALTTLLRAGVGAPRREESIDTLRRQLKLVDEDDGASLLVQPAKHVEIR